MTPYDFFTITRETLMSNGELKDKSYGGWELASTMCEIQQREVRAGIFGISPTTRLVPVYHYIFRQKALK